MSHYFNHVLASESSSGHEDVFAGRKFELAVLMQPLNRTLAYRKGLHGWTTTRLPKRINFGRVGSAHSRSRRYRRGILRLIPPDAVSWSINSY